LAPLRETRPAGKQVGSREGAKTQSIAKRIGLRKALYFCLFPFYFCLVPKCPTCDKPVEYRDNPWRPFCSERCKLIDFGRWTDEEYRVPGQRVNPGAIPDERAPEKSDEED
jgi:uncharacterized protein